MVASSPHAEFIDEFDGVQLKKSLHDEEYKLPSIEYQFTSDREETVTITVRDPIPEDVSLENVGFHRDYGKNYWDIDDAHLVFEYTIEPGEEFKTVYAFRAGSIEMSEELLVAPDSVEVTPAGPAVPEPQGVARSAANSPYAPGEETPVEGTDLDNIPEDGAVDLSEPSDIETIDLDSSEESLVDQLAREIENDEAAPESLETLNEQFGAHETAVGHTDAQISQLQEDIANLRAYTNALEEFLDEEGAAQDIIADFEEQLAEFDTELASVQSTTARLEETIETIEATLEEMDGSVEAMGRELDELREEVETVEADVDSIDERVPAYSIDERFSDLEDELHTMGEFVEKLQSAFE